MISLKVIVVFVLHLIVVREINGNPDAKRLYDDLLSNYNRLIRPVSNNTQTVLVKLGLRLSQLIDLVSVCWVDAVLFEMKLIAIHPSIAISLYLQNLKDQILTTNVWLEHVSFIPLVPPSRERDGVAFINEFNSERIMLTFTLRFNLHLHISYSLPLLPATHSPLSMSITPIEVQSTDIILIGSIKFPSPSRSIPWAFGNWIDLLRFLIDPRHLISPSSSIN